MKQLMVYASLVTVLVAARESRGQTETTTTTTTTEQRTNTEGVAVVPATVPTYVEVPARHRLMDTQVGITLGGGYSAFARGPLGDAINGGGTWNLGVILGAHTPLGLELRYVGSENGLNAADARLVSTAGVADLRLSTPGWVNFPVQLFGLVGVGINRFDLMVSNGQTTTFSKVDTTMLLPLGAGLQFNLGAHWIIDTRFVYNVMFDSDLDRDRNTDMWSATGQLGYVL